MSRSSRVYSVANCDNRARPVGFGGEFTMRVMVGSSASYSNAFANIETRETPIIGDWSMFRLYVDGVIFKRSIFNNVSKAFLELGPDAVATDVIAHHESRS